jgi:hypothetical protein
MKLHNTRDEDVSLEAALSRYRERFDEGAEVVTLRSPFLLDFKSDLKLGNKMMVYDCMDAGRVKAFFGQTIKRGHPR